MLCKIADLYVEVPASGGLALRCREYLTSDLAEADIRINPELYKPDTRPHLNYDDVAYLDSGAQFYRQLLDFDGMMLHSSAVEMDGYAYLFSGPCGMGKSTHTRLWQKTFGSSAQVFNDDKPALRRIDGRWFAYGTPWCGKDSINQNRKVPLGGICFLKQGQENKIRRLNEQEAIGRVLAQTMHKFRDPKRVELMLGHVGNLVDEIPIYLLENRPEPEAALLSHETMLKGVKEAGL